MNKYLVLSGMMSNGKDTVARKLIKNYAFKSCISYTTRPMRNGEINGVDYFFITKDKFHEMANNGEFIETRSYITTVEIDGKKMNDIWFYSLGKQQIVNTKQPRIFIADKQGAEEFIAYVGAENVVWVLLECDEEILKRRALSRGDLSKEIDRRFKKDKQSFKGIDEVVNGIVNTDMPIDRVVEAVWKIYDYWNNEI